MKCPVCQIELNMMERQGIEIDYCPRCRGVWLDRGELDKIIERSASISYEEPKEEYQRGFEYHKRKRRSFLGELLDFD